MSPMSPHTAKTHSDLDVSLEPHLVRALRPLLPILPTALASPLTPLLHPVLPCTQPSASSDIQTVPYSLLLSISRWSRSPAGEHAIRTNSPPLQPEDYDMVSLLAGTRTSPNRRLPNSLPNRSRSTKELNDRRTVTALMNALLSVGGSGAAAWWATGRLGWRDEWRVLFALLIAIIVATSEIVLYLIWDARSSQPTSVANIAPHEASYGLFSLDAGGETLFVKGLLNDVEESVSTGSSTATSCQSAVLRVHGVSADDNVDRDI